MSHDPTNCMLSSIDSTIDTLHALTDSWDVMFTQLQERQLSQAEFDEYIRTKVNPAINARLASIRATLLSALQSLYKQFKIVSDSVSPITEADPTDLQSVIAAVKNIIEWFKKAYEALQEFLTLLPSHLIDLTDAISSVVSYTPPIHGYDTGALSIHMEPITMADIKGEENEEPQEE